MWGRKKKCGEPRRWDNAKKSARGRIPVKVERRLRGEKRRNGCRRESEKEQKKGTGLIKQRIENGAW